MLLTRLSALWGGLVSRSRRLLSRLLRRITQVLKTRSNDSRPKGRQLRNSLQYSKLCVIIYVFIFSHKTAESQREKIMLLNGLSCCL